MIKKPLDAVPISEQTYFIALAIVPADLKENTMNTITYTVDGTSFEAQITRIIDGTIFARTICPNGDLTEEHTIPAAEVSAAVITIESLKSISGDVNKKVSTYLKSAGLNVVSTKVQVLCDAEPGRTWIKAAGQSSRVAYG